MNISKEELDDILSKGKFNNDKYSLKFIDPERRILKVVKKDYGKKPEKGVVTFGDSDLDKGLLSKKSVDVLKELKLPLSSKIKNENMKILKFFKKMLKYI